MFSPDSGHRRVQSSAPSNLYGRYERLRDYLGWGTADDGSVAGLRACLVPHTREFVEDFYAELTRHPAAVAVMTGGAAQIERLKTSLCHWLSDLLSGQYDQDYVMRRWQVGFRHVRIGLDQTFVGVALARLRRCMSRRLEICCAGDAATLGRLSETLHKLLDLDQNLIQAAYETEYRADRQAANEDRLSRLVDRLPVPAVYVRGERLVINPAVAEMTGYSAEELDSVRQWSEITSPIAGDADDVSADQSSIRSRRTIRRRDGSQRLIELFSFRSEDDEVWLLRDITEADLARLKAMQAERLALIGQMITTLAHEARNSLQRIRASTETLELELEDRTDLAPVLTRLGAAQDDLKTLFDEVRNYAAPVAISREYASLCDLAESAWDSLIEPRKGRTAVLRLDGNTGDCEGWFDRFRMQQVFRNLFENSLAACADPVQIVMAFRSAQLDGQSFVELSIRDNGPGLPVDIRERVFEPFFTTKAKGTGLGMAIADRIVTAHGGRIEVGAPVHGAEFRLLLPRTENGSHLADHRGG
jgi:PAS domain S-box-containing protein